MFFIDGGNSRVLIGTDTAVTTSTTGKLQMSGTDNAGSTLTLGRFSANANSANLSFVKSRNASVGGNTVVADGDNLGSITFHASDGSDTVSMAAKIFAEVDGTPGSNDMPGRLTFFTTDDGSDSPTERMRITKLGRVGIGTDSPSSELHVKDASAGSRIIVEASASAQEADIQIKTADDGQGWVLFNNGSANKGVVKYNHASDYMSFRTNGTDDQIKIDSAGHVTMPRQPAFQVRKSSSQDSIPTSTTTITFDSEIFDQNGDFASNTFTAPVTGKYQFNVHIRLETLDSADASFYQMKILTSNRTYIFTLDPNGFGVDLDYYSFAWSALADMDANDTAYITIIQSGGVSQTDIHTESYFSGYLVA
jgi:hypothetical protein